MNRTKEPQPSSHASRRAFLAALAATPAGIAISTRSGFAESEDPVAGFFTALEPLDGSERNEVILSCASLICLNTTDPVSTDELEEVEDLDHHVRRLRFAIRVLNEAGVTTAIDEGMVRRSEVATRRYTKLIPLVGSYNALRSAACAFHQDQTPENGTEFLGACLAFGLEVILWQSNIPYQMAWRQTRFIANRTFLRYARHGCRSCVALAMSELHWVLRGVPYVGLDVARVRFVYERFEELRYLSVELDYDAPVEVRTDDVEFILEELEMVNSEPIPAYGVVKHDHGSTEPLMLVFIGGIFLVILRILAK